MEYVILNEDRDTLERLTGGNVTDDVLAETHLWTRLFHADGNSGPLGTVALIAMLRQLGVPLNAAEPKAEPFDWSSLPQDGSVVVEAMFPERHEYAIGRFVGFVSMGTLAIKVGQFVLECAPINVRLKGQSEGGVTDTLSVATFAEEGPAPPGDAGAPSLWGTRWAGSPATGWQGPGRSRRCSATPQARTFTRCRSFATICAAGSSRPR